MHRWFDHTIARSAVWLLVVPVAAAAAGEQLIAAAAAFLSMHARVVVVVVVVYSRSKLDIDRGEGKIRSAEQTNLFCSCRQTDILTLGGSIASYKDVTSCSWIDIFFSLMVVRIVLV